MMHYYGGSGFGFHGFGFIFPLLILIIFLLVIYWVLKSGNLSSDSAEEILKKRLAKGEINKKEYRDLLKEINE